MNFIHSSRFSGLIPPLSMSLELSLELPEEIVEHEVNLICKQYRIAPEEAKNFLEQNFQRRLDILKKILAKYPEEDITRLSVYKTMIKNVRKQVYYHLRQYQGEMEKIECLRKQLEQLIRSSEDPRQIKHVINQLLSTHVSTKERANDYQTFYQRVFELIEPPRTILDIGCGIHPLSYPFEQLEYCPEVYVAIDRNPEVIETLTIFALYVKPTHLIPICADIAEANWTTYLEGGIDTFNVAFMLKLIPVVSRQQRHLLPKLAGVPARQILITAAAEAMTRKNNIRRREERVLHKFIEMTDKKIIATFQLSNEFGYLIGETGDLV